MSIPLHRLTLAALFLPWIGAGAPTPPKLRLPDSVVPASYRAELTLDPDKETFSGSVNIEVNVKQSVELVWLNASGITVQDAAFVVGNRNLTAKAVPGGEDFLGLQFESPLPTGPAQIKIRYTGAIRQKDSSGIFKM